VDGIFKHSTCNISYQYDYNVNWNLHGDQMKSKMWTDLYLIGWVLILTSFYLNSEGRGVSATLFLLAGNVVWMVDLYRKVKYVIKLRKEIKEKIKNKDKKE